MELGHGGRSRWGSDFDHLESPATALAPIISRGSEITKILEYSLSRPFTSTFGNFTILLHYKTVKDRESIVVLVSKRHIF